MADTLGTHRLGTIRIWLWALAVAILIRAIAAAVLPLSFDEAYYWLWSKHLAAGYYDHPPLIAYAIWLGTWIGGKTAWGVRLLPWIFSLIATWAVLRSTQEWTGHKPAGIFAALAFNLMLMTTVEMLSATPDAPLLLFSSLFVLFMVRLVRRGEARWWLAAGAAGGFALLSKYTALFLGAGAFVYLVGSANGRRWLLTPWPYAGAALAIAIFAPDIWWNAQRDWISFRFQFGKAGSHHFAPGYLGEFIAGQIALASPLILALAIGGLTDIKRNRLLGLLVLPAVVFFVTHALQTRVQGNWPSFLYPILAVAAAAAALRARGAVLGWCRDWALPSAAVLLALLYVQAFFAVLPIRDPISHLLAVGFTPVAQAADAWVDRTHAAAIVTSAYAPTGWLAFYGSDTIPVIQWNESQRWQAAPPASATQLSAPLVYIAEPHRDEAALMMKSFTTVRKLTTLERMRGGLVLGAYDVYLLDGWHGPVQGRVVN